MTESGHSSIALIIADMPSPPQVSDFELGLAAHRDSIAGFLKLLIGDARTE
jgi:hypothetical protein